MRHNFWVVLLILCGLFASSCDKSPVTITVNNQTDASVTVVVDGGRYRASIEANSTNSVTLDVNYKPKVIEILRTTPSGESPSSRWEFEEKTDDFDDLEITVN
jgi:hypothetical protein